MLKIIVAATLLFAANAIPAYADDDADLVTALQACRENGLPMPVRTKSGDPILPKWKPGYEKCDAVVAAYDKERAGIEKRATQKDEKQKLDLINAIGNKKK